MLVQGALDTDNVECPNAEAAERGVFDNDDDMGQEAPAPEQPEGAAEAAELAATRLLVPSSLQVFCEDWETQGLLFARLVTFTYLCFQFPYHEVYLYY